MKDAYQKPSLSPVYFEEFVNDIPSQSGKTVAITGTTTGTGFVAALTLAQKGATLLLLNRHSDRLTNSLKALETACPEGKFISVNCDLSDFSSVKSAASIIHDLCPNGLDALCNNAGVMALKDEATIDGFDIQMQTNHLSHFLLSKELLPLLEKAASKKGESRIVNHSSAARHMVKHLESKYLDKNGGNLGGNCARMFFFPKGRWIRYAHTKLANAVFTSALHDRLQSKSSKIKAIVAHPGLSVTFLQDTAIRNGGMSKWMAEFLMKNGQTQEDGSIGIIKGIVDPQLSSGDFIGPGEGKMALKGPVKVFPINKSHRTPSQQSLLWEMSCKAIGESFEI
tara:strand:+ start:1096 stop:2112 length:1017 start_codon:yes stop_codon:yes gene_type:complete